MDHAALVSVRGEPWTDSRNMTFKSGQRKMPEKELGVEEENKPRGMKLIENSRRENSTISPASKR